MKGLRTIYRPGDIANARHHAAHSAWGRQAVEHVLEVCRDRFDLPSARLASLVPEKTPLVSGHCPVCGAHFASARILDHGQRLRCEGCRTEWECEDPDRSEEWDLYGAMRSFRLRYLYLGLENLGLAWQLTGEGAWADRAAAVVRRFAEVFKGYRLNAIHRNVWLRRPHPYWGRIDGWKFRDGLCVSRMLLTYDLTRDSGALNEAEKAAIDRDLVAHAVDYFVESFGPRGYLSARAMQDMGHAIECIAMGAAILGDEQRLDSFHQLFHDLCSGRGRVVFFPEDGAFYQGTFSYAMQLLKPLTSVAEILRDRVYADPACALLRKVYTWPLDTAWPAGLPVALNDSHVGVRTYQWETRYSQIAWYRLGDPRGLKRLQEAFGADLQDGDLQELFLRPRQPADVQAAAAELAGAEPAAGKPPVAEPPATRPDGAESSAAEPAVAEPAEYADRSVHLTGLRFAALRHGPARSRMTMAFLDYGRPLGHHHHDFLNIGLWAHGRVMLSEMGYKYKPPWILDWCRSPMAHNLVLELAALRATRARCYVWHPGPPVHAVEAGLPGAAARRLLCLVPVSADQAYLVDVYWAAAGTGAHTWVQHATTRDLRAERVPDATAQDLRPERAHDATTRDVRSERAQHATARDRRAGRVQDATSSDPGADNAQHSIDWDLRAQRPQPGTDPELSRRQAAHSAEVVTASELTMHEAQGETPAPGSAADLPPGHPARDAEAPLQNARNARTSEDILLRWTYDDGVALRTWMAGAPGTEVTLSTCPAEEGLLAEHFNDAGAVIPGTQLPERGIAMIRRREPLSCFAAVHEPCRHGSLLRGIRVLEPTRGEGVVLEIEHERDGRRIRDLFLQVRPGSRRRLEAAGAALTGRAAWCRYVDGELAEAALLGGRRLRVGDVVVTNSTPGRYAARRGIT